MRRTPEQAQATRDSLLAAALQVFVRDGYSAARLEDIAGAAGVTRGALYHHFEGKADLYTTLVGTASLQLQPVVEGALSGGGSASESLRRFFVDVLVRTVEDAHFRAVTELTLFRTELSDELAEGLGRKRQGTRALTESLASVVARGVADGELRPDVDPVDAALGLVALQNGMLGSWLIDPERFDLAERAGPIVDLYLAGLAL